MIVPKERNVDGATTFNMTERDSSEMLRTGNHANESFKDESGSVTIEESPQVLMTSPPELVIEEMNHSKKNIFQKVTEVLRLKKLQNTSRETIEHSISIDQIKIKDFVLSRYELERIPIPLLKNFCFQELEVKESTENSRAHPIKSFNLSMLSHDLEQNSCCSGC